MNKHVIGPTPHPNLPPQRGKGFNWLLLLALLIFSLLVSLGCWQLSRAKEKEALMDQWKARAQHPPLHAQNLFAHQDLYFYPVELRGQFDEAHTILLDNKTMGGQVGYEIYTPFIAEGLTSWILVDRGFVGGGQRRQNLPQIKRQPGRVTLQGILDTPPRYMAFGKMQEGATIWPLRVQFIDLSHLSTLLSGPLFPYVVLMQPSSTSYPIVWRVATMSPDRHRGYAVQWFALALTLVVICIVLYRRQRL